MILHPQGSYGDAPESVLYGVFRTPPNSISGSAVCAFRLRDVTSVFDGQFKEQRSTSDNWLAVEPHKVPSPRPGETKLIGNFLSNINVWLRKHN